MPNQIASAVLSSPGALAPDLVAVLLGAQPHPDMVIPEPLVTVAALAAAARSAAAAPGAEPDAPVTLKWDGPRQQLTR